MPKSDRQAITTILVLSAIVGIAIYALNFIGLKSNPIDNETANSKYGNSANTTTRTDSRNSQQTDADTNGKLFYFDPNTADSTQLAQLGLRKWQIRNIYRYRANGGTYSSKEDFAFVYGLTVKEYRRLAPYIRISEDYLPAYMLAEVKHHNKSHNNEQRHIKSQIHNNDKMSDDIQLVYTNKIKKGEQIAVNASDTSSLQRIPGIGSYYARQTVRYRDRLGGFVNKKQLLEIENFPEESLQYISIDTENIKKIKINRLSLSQLRRHPYINYYQARAITDYRRLHGEIKNIKELKLMKEFTESDLNRIIPYIEY